MSPRDFLSDVVLPNISDFHTHFADLRHAFNAIAGVDALAAHLYLWATTNAQTAVASINDDSHYRQSLAVRNQDFALLRDMAKAQKHVYLTRHSPQVVSANQITSRSIGYGVGGYGAGRFGGVEQVVVDIAPGNFLYVEAVIDDALAFMESEMMSLGVP